MDDQELRNYCDAWSYWCSTRKYYLQPGAKNILARMQPSKVRQPPDARNYPNMQYFNMAVHALADMPEYHDGLVCFNFYYVEQSPNIKSIAFDLGISRPTYYNRAKAFARKAYSLSLSIKEAHEMMAAELVG